MRFQFGFSGLLLNVRTDALIKLFGGFLSLSLSDLVCDRYIQHHVLAVHIAVRESQLVQGKFCCLLTWLLVLVLPLTNDTVLGKLASALLSHLPTWYYRRAFGELSAAKAVFPRILAIILTDP